MTLIDLATLGLGLAGTTQPGRGLFECSLAGVGFSRQGLVDKYETALDWRLFVDTRFTVAISLMAKRRRPRDCLQGGTESVET